jgi:pyrroloquinoline-quinone synthase
MTTAEFAAELDARIAKFDLLCHPFYKAWSEGQLTREDLREYALDYYEHVKAFPTYLAELAIRLDEGHTRRAVLANMAEEMGRDSSGRTSEPSHAELWMDFAEGMGARREYARPALKEIHALVEHFNDVSSEGTVEEALAAFYAYESQVPRIATEKERGLRAWYGADDKTCSYFTLHQTADVYHSQVWRKLLEKQVAGNSAVAEKALAAGEAAAAALWGALDGMESRRQSAVAA